MVKISEKPFINYAHSRNDTWTTKCKTFFQVLVDDDWVSQGILHLIEEEKFVAEGAGATSLGALLAVPNILPELREKK